MMTREKEAELLKTIQGMFPGADVVRLTGRPVVFTPCSNPDCCASPSHAPCGGEAKQPGIVELLNDYTERAAEFERLSKIQDDLADSLGAAEVKLADAVWPRPPVAAEADPESRHFRIGGRVIEITRYADGTVDIDDLDVTTVPI